MRTHYAKQIALEAAREAFGPSHLFLIDIDGA
jgi:hypothetical protein